MKAAVEQGITNVTQLSNASGIPYNALRNCKEKNKPLSDAHKHLLAKALKCSVGDINRMMSEARAEELKKDWPDKATCSPAKNETAETEAASPEPFKLREEETFGLPVPPKSEVVKLDGPSYFEPVPEPEPEQEQEPVPEAPPAPTADDVADAKIAEIVTNAGPLLTYHDRIKEAAKVTLEAEYAAMLRSRMLAVAISDLSDLCAKFVQAPDPNEAVEFREIASEIIKLKEE